MREHVDLPTLDACEREWRQHPPVHHLVASFLGYEGEPEQEAGADEAEDDNTRPAWLGGMGSVQAPGSLAEAVTAEEALAAAERLFFGDVKDVKQL